MNDGTEVTIGLISIVAGFILYYFAAKKGITINRDQILAFNYEPQIKSLYKHDRMATIFGLLGFISSQL